MGKLFAFCSKTWSHLTTLGAVQQDVLLRKRIILTNKFSLTLSAIGALYCLGWLKAGNITVAVFNAICAVVFFSFPWLNNKGFTRTTRTLVLVTINLAIFLIVGSNGKVGDSQVTFYSLAGIAFLLFEPKEKISITLALLMPMTLFGILFHYDFKLFTLFHLPEDSDVPVLATYYSNFLIIILCMFYLFRETEKAEENLKVTNEKLLNNQVFLNSVIENIPLLFYTKDSENRYTIINPEFEKSFNVKESDVLYKKSSAAFPGATADYLAIHDHEIVDSRSSKIFEASIRLDPDHKEKTYLWTKFPVLGPQGEVFGICGIALDISMRIEAQKKLDEQRALLINNMKLSALSEMAGGMAHEINNPLTTISLIQEKLQRIIPQGPVSSEVLKDSLIKIQTNVQRIADIVTALRKFIGESSASDYEMINLQDLINDTLELCQEKFKQGGVNFKISSQGMPFLVLCKADGIRQVIYNLLTNAYDAVENRPNAMIELETVYNDNKVQIIIRDSGTSIPKDLANKMFQPFFTTKETGKGQGLGLSIARGIINSHGGKLSLDTSSKLTTFVAELPRPAS